MCVCVCVVGLSQGFKCEAISENRNHSIDNSLPALFVNHYYSLGVNKIIFKKEKNISWIRNNEVSAPKPYLTSRIII